MRYKWRILYYPPEEELINNDPDTWRKVFLIDRYTCPEKLDLGIKVRQLINDYNMNKDYVIIENLDTKESSFFTNKRPVSFERYSFIDFDN